jgi:DNA (cytosine-5)-methyltransferase 1
MIKILELFSGYGGGSFSLSKACIDFECIGYSDIEDCANYIYDLNHGGKALGDVTKIVAEDLEDFDLLTGGFPCQSFSIAGKRQGFEAANKGKLFFEIIRIARIKKPCRMLLENVEGILSHDNGKTFEIVLMSLKEIGYKVKWQKLYSKQHGTPQNRPRIWFACFREQQDYDKFMFPEIEPLKITVKDLLEDEVDKKYYLSEKQLERVNNYNITNKEKGRGFNIEPVGNISSTLTNHAHKDNNSIPIIADFRYDEGIRPRENGVSPTLCSTQKSGNGLSGMPIISSMQQHNTITESNIINTLPSAMGLGGGHTPMVNVTQWRRIIPRECFRLQGFFNDEIKFGNLSDSKLYFLAGNGWDINVASKIFTQMFKGNQNKQNNLSQFGL